MPSRRRSMQSRISRRVLSKKRLHGRWFHRRVRPFDETIRFPGTIPKEAFHSLMMKAWNTESEIHGAQERLLIMEGGAMRGLFTAGVLDAFMEEGLYFPCSMGISAGSMQGLCYLAHQRGRSLRMNTRFAKDPRYMGLRHLVKRGSYFNFHFIFGELSESIDPYDFVTA